MRYDKAYVARWREKAITKPEDLKIGQTYYSNAVKSPFTITDLLSSRDHWRELGISEWQEASPDIAWFKTNHGDIHSFRDRNIGASYNPWLIFARESDLKEYEAGLHYTLGHKPMNLYLIADSGEGGYDTFACAVVRAASEAAARRIHPNGRSIYIDNPTDSEANWDWERTWVPPSKVVVTHLGTSVLDEPRVVCASFNAG